MESVSNWRIRVYEVTTREGVTVPTGAVLVSGDEDRPLVRQCEQIVFDPSTDSHLALVDNRLIRLQTPHESWRTTLYRSGTPVRAYLSSLGLLLDDLQALNAVRLH